MKSEEYKELDEKNSGMMKIRNLIQGLKEKWHDTEIVFSDFKPFHTPHLVKFVSKVKESLEKKSDLYSLFKHDKSISEAILIRSTLSKLKLKFYVFYGFRLKCDKKFYDYFIAG